SFGNLLAGGSCTVAVSTPTSPANTADCVAFPGLQNTACVTDDEGNSVCNGANTSCETGCPDANPRLGGGTISDCAILQSDAFKVDITGPAGQIQGDICIGPGGKLSMSGENFTTDNVRLDVGATCAGCSKARVLGKVFHNPPDPEGDLSAEIAACDQA